MGDLGRTGRWVGVGGLVAAVATAAWAGGLLGRAPAAAAVDAGDAADTVVAADPAAAPATAPSSTGRPPDPMPNWPGMGGRYGHGRGGYGRFGGPPLTPADRTAALDFVAQHAPEQYRTVNALPEDSDERRVVEVAMTRAYLNYQRLKADQPEVYDVIVKRVEAEDQVYALTGEFRHAPEADRPAIRKRLHDQVAAWFDLNLTERQLRLNRLEQQVRTARTKLAADTDHRDRQVEDRVGRILNGGGGILGGSDGWMPAGGSPAGGSAGGGG